MSITSKSLTLGTCESCLKGWGSLKGGYLLPLMGTVAPGSPLRPQGQPPCLAPGPECWWRLGLACIGQTAERPRLLGVWPHHPEQQHLCRNSPTPEKKTNQSKLLLGGRKRLAPSEFWCGQAALLAMSRNLNRSKHCIPVLSTTSPMSWIQGRESCLQKASGDLSCIEHWVFQMLYNVRKLNKRQEPFPCCSHNSCSTLNFQGSLWRQGKWHYCSTLSPMLFPLHLASTVFLLQSAQSHKEFLAALLLSLGSSYSILFYSKLILGSPWQGKLLKQDLRY